MKVYISGKITDKDPTKQKENIALFRKKKQSVFMKNPNLTWNEIINPCDIKPLFGIKKYWFFMAADLYVLFFKCSHIYLIENWKESKGAKIEVFLSILLRKKFL